MGVRVCRISFIVLFCLFIIVQSSGVADGKNNGEYVGEKKGSVSEMVKGLFSISTSSPFTSKYWDKVRTLFHQGRGYFSSPSLNFRKDENAEVNEGGMGENVKEAAVKSMGKSKETIEDSAEKAAEVVGETAKKLKITSSKRREDDRSEL